MNTKSPNPTTLIEAVRHFSDLDVCHEYMVSIKWPDSKVDCPKCGSDQIGEIKSRRMFQCKDKDCRKQFSAKVGTIFEDSPLALDKWFVAVWCIANAKNGISSCELARATGVTQKSAWHMLHRIRLAMQTKSFNLIKGTVEADETFIGGKARNMHKSKRKGMVTGGSGKAVVMGLLERNTKGKSRVRVKHVASTKRSIIREEVRMNVYPGAEVHTDAMPSYTGLDAEYVHKVVDHAECYVKDNVHTNGLENFWSLLKRSIKGTYVSIEPFHLFRYLDEQAFRFNKREGNDGPRFQAVMSGVVGKRLQYATLTSSRS